MDTGRIRNIAGFSLLTVLLYNVGILSPMFALPLQLSAEGKNKGRFLSTSLVSAAAIFLIRTMMLRSLDAAGFVVFDAVILTAVVCGLYICNFGLKLFSLPVRISIISGGAGLAVLLLVPAAEGFKDLFIRSLDSLAAVGQELQLTVPGTETFWTGETLYAILTDFAGKTGLFWYSAFLAFSYETGRRIGLYGKMRAKEGQGEEWKLPEIWVWLLFIPLTLFLADRLLGRNGASFLEGRILYLVSNMILITSGAYGVRGIGIIRLFLKNRGIAPSLQRLLFMPLIFLLLMPGLNLALLIIVAGIGVSELWVNYRIFDKE